MRAADLLDRAQNSLRDTGRLGLLLHVLGIYNHLLVELGELTRPAVVVAEADRLEEDTRQPVWNAGTLPTGGRLVAFQGDPDRAITMAEQATRLAGTSTTSSGRPYSPPAPRTWPPAGTWRRSRTTPACSTRTIPPTTGASRSPASAPWLRPR